MKHINLDGLVPKRIKILCLRLVLVSVLVIACSFVVAAQGNQNSEIANNEKPDLVVDSIIWEPINPKTRDDVTVSIVCANRGDAPTVKGFSIYLYVDDQLVETKYLKPLNAGSSENVPPITWKVDEDIIGGTHTFFAYVNQDKSGSKSYIKESDNSNNQRSETFYVTSRLPDLKLVDISWRPLYISNGDSVTFAVDYSNIGHMSTDKRTTIWLYVDNKLVNKAKNIGLLAPDETGSVQIPWTVGRDFKGGEHDVTAYIDRDKDNNHYSNVVQEENEQNNMISKVFWTNRNESFTDITIVVKDINSKPIESANIFVDKNYVGNTDSRGELTSKVTEGQKHTIEAESYGYLTKEKDITVKYNSKLQPFSIFLEYGSAPVTLYVKSSSKEPIINAEVSVGGDSIGTTNSNGVLKFEAGKDSIVTVEINKRGYYSYGPVGISVSKYGASETIELNPVPKPVIKFWSTNNASHVGNETIFTLGALNPMTSPEDVTVQLVITPPSGVLVDATYFVKSGGVFYQNTEPIAPGRESKITLSMIGNEVGYYTIPANVYYYYSNQGKDKIPELNTTLSLQVNSNEIVEPKSPTPHWLPGFGAPSFILVMLIAASINRLQKKQVWQ